MAEPTTVEAPVVPTTASDSTSIPNSWLRLGAPLVVGLLLGGGSVGGVTGALGVGPKAVAEGSALSAETFSSWAGSHSSSPHVGAAHAEDVEQLARTQDDTLYIVCRLAEQADPPVRDRRCEQL